MKRLTEKIALIAALALLGVGQGRAGTTTFDFNSDPTAGGLLNLYGTCAWYPYDGVGYSTNYSDGFLQVTAPQAGQGGRILFADFDNGAVVQGFTFECDLRIGGGTADPADGFSINYARANDPVVVNPASGAFASSPGCEAGLPEEGTQTGIAIGFDAWQSGSGTGCSTIGPDVIGISIRVDNNLISQTALPTKNGACEDATSLQTGPRTGPLCWAHLKVDLSTANMLNVWWKGRQILTNYQCVGYYPSPGRLVFAGRTGDAYETHDVDNISITTIAATLPLVGLATGQPDGFSVEVADAPNSIVDPNVFTAKLDGVTVSPLSITKIGTSSTVTYHGFPTLLAVGSTHSIEIAGKDMNNNAFSGTRSFTVPYYGSVVATDALATGVDTSKPGFRLMPWQSGSQPNALYWTAEQLVGLRGANNANLASATDGGYIDHTGVINFNITPASSGGGDAGNFTTANGYPDSLFPGIPGANGLNGSTAMEALTFLKFSAAGLYEMGVNSDDGFLVTEGAGVPLGWYNGGKGSSDIRFTFAVLAPGIYPFRLIWENGNGEAGNGANCEWFTIKDGVKYLINDPASISTTGIEAYYAGPMPGYVALAYPYDGATGARADKLVVMVNDIGNSVNTSSLKFTVDGTPITATVNKSGTMLTATANITLANLMAPGKRAATIQWNDNAGNLHTAAWSFTVADFTTLDTSLAVPLSAGDASKPGFTLQVVQLDPDIMRPGKNDGMANQIDSANALLGGCYFPWYGSNTADLINYLTPPVYSNVWYWSNVVDFNVSGSAGDFANDASWYLPGIPGYTVSSGNANNNFAASFDGYVAFPTAGFYRMAINSDDNFRVTEGVGITRQVLHITGSGVDRDVAAVVVSTNKGDTFGGTLPKVPISGPVAYFPAGDAYLVQQATNLTGKIAVMNNTDYYDRQYADWAQANGAIAAIIINDQQWGLPYVLGGSDPATPIHIPVLCVNGFGGEEQVWATNQNLVASIGADANLQVGVTDGSGGKGMSWVDFSFVVPQPGLYPMRVVWEQGGGGAGIEWATVSATSLVYDAVTRTLVNDSASSQKAYRAVTELPRPTMSLSFQGGSWKIVYTGTLQSSVTANGTYEDVQSAASPYTVPTGSGPSMFYRARN